MALTEQQKRAVQDAAIREYCETRLNHRSPFLAEVNAADAREKEQKRQEKIDPNATPQNSYEESDGYLA